MTNLPLVDSRGYPLPTPSLADDILNAVDALVCVVDGSGALVYISPAVKTILGYEIAEVLGEGWWGRVYRHDPEFGELVRSRLAKTARGEIPVMPEAHTAKASGASGSEHWIVWRDAKGPGDYVIGVGQDITELHQAEQRVELQEREFRAIFENASDGMLILDQNWIYQEANEAACKIFGKTKAQIIGKPQGSVQNSSVDFSLIREQAVQTGSVRTELTFVRGQQEDGDTDERTLEFTVATNVFAGRHLIVLRDITDQRKLQVQLEEAHRLEAVGRLAGGVAHDFNNMLTAIRGYGELMLRHASEDRQKRYATSILGATERAEHTTRQLLAFSRKQMMTPKLLNLNESISDMAGLLHRVIGDDVELVLLLAENTGDVMADPGQLSQILMNLAVNSRDAMPNGGKLIIETRGVELDDRYVLRHVQVEPGSYALMAVTDTGAGIPPEVLGHIFEPFFTTKEVGKGTGLGLATVYGTVKQSGGYIWVYSEVGQGTTFKIYLPRIGHKELQNSERLHRKVTVLLIEDDAAMRSAIAEQLLSEDYQVMQAADGAEALQVCLRHAQAIDVVLTDVNATRMSGEDLMGYFAIKYPRMVVIHMSGFSRHVLEQMHSIPPDALFLSKPFTAEQLRQTMLVALQAGEQGEKSRHRE